LRQEIGNQAKVLNEIVEIIRQTHHIDSEKVRELIGHTWAEVFGGLALGFLIALLIY
jgi:acid phosphatase family membrane protein YuiD